jgi:signal transduction histidine kinase
MNGATGGRAGLLLAFFMAILSARAERLMPAVMDTGIACLMLNPVAVVYEAPRKLVLSPDSVLRMPDSLFTPATSKAFLFGLTEIPRWLRFNVVNPTTDSRRLLLEIANPNLRHVEVYQYWGELLIQSDTAGIDFPFERRPVPAQNFLFPMHLKAGDTLTCLVYVAPSYQPANFDLYLWQRHHRITAQSTRESLVLGGFFVIHLAFWALLVAVAASFRLREMAYYAAYVLMGALFVFSDVGLGYRFLWSEWPYWQKVFSFAAICLYTIFGTQFIRLYFNTRKRFPVFEQIFFYAIAVCFALLISLLFIPVLPLRFVHILSILLYIVFLACSAAFVALFVYTLSRKSKLWSVWLLLGFSLHGVGIVVTLLQYMRLLPQYSLAEGLYEAGFPLTFHTQILMMAGMTLEIPVVLYTAFARFKYVMKQNQTQAVKLAELRRKSMNDLLLGIESERRRLSQDLHDGLGVSLAAMKMKANLMEMRAAGEDKNAWRELMYDLETTYEELRRISHNLPPKSLFRTGMHSALEEVLQRTRTLRPELSIDYFNNLPLNRLSQQAEINLFRITLELLNNALKHSEASRLSVQWLTHEKEIVLTVEDNGKGFQTGKTTGDGIGLANVRNRVEVLGGQMSTDSQPGHGATIVIRVPNEAAFPDLP